MDYIKGQSRMQTTMLPDCIDDLTDRDSAVRVTEALV